MNELYNQIISLNKLTPSKQVNVLFTKLVSLTFKSDVTNTLSKGQIAKLRLICSRAEFELEKYWVKKIIRSKNPLKEVRKFPYYKNYEKLTKMEWFSLLGCAKHKSHKILFVGGGPLPLTAIILAQKYKCNVIVIDKDKEACELSLRLVSQLGLSKEIKIINSDGEEFNKYYKFDVIFIAALAGISKNTKEKVLTQIKKHASRDTHILARSSWGMREILYRPLDKKLFKLFKPVIEVRPYNEIVNSVIIFSNQ